LANEPIDKGSTEELKNLQEAAKIQEYKNELGFKLEKDPKLAKTKEIFTDLILGKLEGSLLSEKEKIKKAEKIYKQIAGVIKNNAVDINNTDQVIRLLS
jgi:hypothetical protein